MAQSSTKSLALSCSSLLSLMCLMFTAECNILLCCNNIGIIAALVLLKSRCKTYKDRSFFPVLQWADQYTLKTYLPIFSQQCAHTEQQSCVFLLLYHNSDFYICLSKCIEQDCVKVLVKYSQYSKLYAFFFRNCNQVQTKKTNNCSSMYASASSQFKKAAAMSSFCLIIILIMW